MPWTDEAPRIIAAAVRRRGPASTEDGQRSRVRVLQTAEDLIVEVGIGQLRIAEIARRASMSSGQVMYYFASKEHILLETLTWRDHQDIVRTRAAVAKTTGTWQQLERFIVLCLPSGPAHASWILWLEAWARAPHNRQVTQFLEELLAPWRETLAAIVADAVAAGAFVPPLPSTTSPCGSRPCSTGSRSCGCGRCTSRPASAWCSSP